MSDRITCLWRTQDDEPCPMTDRNAEQRFIAIQTTVIVVGIVVHSVIMAMVGSVISKQLHVKPADVLRQVQEVRQDQEQQYGELTKRLDGDSDQYPPRLQVILDAIQDLEERFEPEVVIE